MGAMSRNKGRDGEQELARAIRALTGWEVRRRVRQHEGDSDLEGVPRWSIEAKRRASATRADIRRWWEQAVQQAQPGEVPVLFFRLDRDGWRAVWPLQADLPERWARDYEFTAEGSLAAWAMVAREISPLARSDGPQATTPAARSRSGQGWKASA